MARVCEKWFPNKNPDKCGFYMDNVLKSNLDVLLKNAAKKDDWDFLGIISGSGRVRVGKSVLELQILSYWVYMLWELYKMKIPFSIKENIVFVGSKLIEQGNLLGKKYPQSVLGFDEAGADLESVKVLRSTTQAVKDFLRECGQYNLFTLLVIPEFFDLPKGIALSRSDFLIDCYILPNKKGKFERGFYNFYSRPNKKMLYIKGKKELNYKAYKYNFHGRFYNFYPVDEKEYRKAKQVALESREKSKADSKYKQCRDALLKILTKLGYSTRKIEQELRNEGAILTQRGISGILSSEKAQI